MILNVIIPVFNEIKTINIVVDNVLKFKELETKIIIVDDCSTDGTSEELKKIQEKNIPKVKIEKLTFLFNQGKLLEVVKEAKNLISKYPNSIFLWNILGASNIQVRKKMYKGSSQQWKKYKPWLQPMLNNLKKN